MKHVGVEEQHVAGLGLEVDHLESPGRLLDAFGIGAGCVAVAGALVAPFFYVAPDVGESFIIMAFVVVVLGGMGNFVGALLGGLIVGLAESLGATLLPGSLKQLIVFALFVQTQGLSLARLDAGGEPKR